VLAGLVFFKIMKRIAKLLGYVCILTVQNTVEATKIQQDLHEDWLSIYVEPLAVSLR